MYTLIGSPRTRTFRVMWMLEEAGLDYTLNPAPPQSEPVRMQSDLGKVPVLVAEGQAITDSAAILTYLADKHGIMTHPAGTIERAKQDALTHFVLDEFDAVLWTAARHSFILPEDRRVPEVKDSLRWEMEKSVQALVARIGHGPFLMGEDLTIADILTTHCLTWAQVAKFQLESQVLTDYVARMQARPAYQAAVAKGQAAMEAAQ